MTSYEYASGKKRINRDSKMLHSTEHPSTTTKIRSALEAENAFPCSLRGWYSVNEPLSLFRNEDNPLTPIIWIGGTERLLESVCSSFALVKDIVLNTLHCVEKHIRLGEMNTRLQRALCNTIGVK